jgi:aminopeptidase N
MFSKFLFIAFVLIMANFISAQVPPLETGVSQALAHWRAANYSDVRYNLGITLEKGAPLMKGKIEIHVNLTETGAKSDLILDWRATQFAGNKEKPYAKVVEVNDKTVSPIGGVDMPNYYVASEHLGVSRFLLKAGENVVKIEFASPVKTSGAAVTRYIDKEDGAEYVYSLFVPSDASTAFPVFDQPDLKARFALWLTVPYDWQAVSNGRLIERGEVAPIAANGEPVPPSTVQYIFDGTQPISTYVFSFAAGRFVEFEDKQESPNGYVERAKFRYKGEKNTSSIYVRKSQAAKFKPHAAETFRLNREAVKYLETYFDFKFPFPKYDLVLIPEFPFNGMEHAGATFIRESSVIFPSEPTKNDFVSRANVIFHEAAHQWFGDTVTMKWFDDLWLKEGFAEFMAYKTLEKVLPEYNAWKAFYERNKPLAYLTDSTRGTTPIYQEIPNLSSAKSAYGNIVYRKAPSFLRQAEFYLGEDKFQTAVRAFLKKYQYKNAEWTDLVREFEAASNQDLKSWANAWVKNRGLLKLTHWEDIGNCIDVRYFEQANVLGDDFTWDFRAKALILYEDRKTKEKKQRIVEYKLGKEKVRILDADACYSEFGAGGNYRLNAVLPNYQDYGYGIFLLDAESRAYVLKNIQNEKDDFLRSMMWGALWDSVRETELAPRDYVELAIKNISVETDELTIQAILNRVSTAMNYYLSDAGRDRLAPELENLLSEKMRTAPSLGLRITYYRAFLNVTSSEKAKTVLKEVLNGKFEIKDWKLKTKDKFDIVAKLAVLGDADAPKLLGELVKKETSDDAKRYAYAVGAGFGAKEAKGKYFNDFLNDREISESWIEAAFAPFNSVRHSELTLPFLEKALAELPNLKRSRKIFFVNGWLGSFIGGQKDEKALAAVNKFLAENPNLDKDLRLKILENADALERAVRIRARYAEK